MAQLESGEGEEAGTVVLCHVVLCRANGILGEQQQACGSVENGDSLNCSLLFLSLKALKAEKDLPPPVSLRIFDSVMCGKS